VDALDGVLVPTRRDEHNRCSADLSKPPGGLYSLPAALETNAYEASKIRFAECWVTSNVGDGRSKSSYSQKSFQYFFSSQDVSPVTLTPA
jgi:hypothetical protein